MKIYQWAIAVFLLMFSTISFAAEALFEGTWAGTFPGPDNTVEIFAGGPVTLKIVDIDATHRTLEAQLNSNMDNFTGVCGNETAITVFMDGILSNGEWTFSITNELPTEPAPEYPTFGVAGDVFAFTDATPGVGTVNAGHADWDSEFAINAPFCSLITGSGSITDAKTFTLGDTIDLTLLIDEFTDGYVRATATEVIPDKAQLTLIKTVSNDHGGTAVVADWALTATGPTAGVTGKTGDAAITSVEVTPGDYTLSELGSGAGATGYAAGNWECTGTATPVTAGGVLTIVAGETAVCTINNTDIAPQLTLVKIVTNDNGGNAGPDDFGIKVAGNVVTSGAKYSYTSGTPLALTEDGLAGYHFVSMGDTIDDSAACPLALGGSIILWPGDDVTCTITNAFSTANITLQKNWMPGVAGNTADLTISGLNGAPTIQSTAVGGHQLDVIQTVKLAGQIGETITFSEVLSDNDSYTTSFTCTNATNTPVEVTSTQHALVLAAADTNKDIVCTYGNILDSVFADGFESKDGP